MTFKVKFETSLAFACFIALQSLALASVPAIENAPTDVEGYAQCLRTALSENTWGPKTAAFCRDSYPAVNALYRGDYVSLTFNSEQENIYRQSRERWITHDKQLAEEIISRVIPQDFNSTDIKTAYSFHRIKTALLERYSEIMNDPFTWREGSSVIVRTRTGEDLPELHTSELKKYNSCLSSIILGRDYSRAEFDEKSGSCLQEISRENHDGSSGIYGTLAFDALLNQQWLAQLQRQKEELQELSKAKNQAVTEERNSLSGRLKRSTGYFVIIFLVALGSWYFWLKSSRNTRNNNAYTLPEVRITDSPNDERRRDTRPRTSNIVMSKCKHCDSPNFGYGCIGSSTKKHEHNGDERWCEYCGSPNYGYGCHHSPTGKHRHGIGGSKCRWCASPILGMHCHHSPSGRHER